MDDQQPKDQTSQQPQPNSQQPPSPSPTAPTPQAAPAPGGKFSTGQSAKYVVKVDQNLCIGAASCVALAPKIFQLNQDNKAYVVDPSGDTEENLKAAAQSCPVNAIILENKETGTQEYP